MDNSIKYWRKKKKLNQDELGKKLGVNGSTISKYENNIIQPTSDMLIKLSDALDCKLDELLGIVDDAINNVPCKTEDDVLKIPVFKNIKFEDNITKDNPNIIRWIPIARERFKNCNTLFFKEVQTDEMNPLLFKGDLVLFEMIRPGIDKIHTGDVCLCTKGDEDAVIREMVTTSNGYVFNLMNVNMPPVPKTMDNIKEEDINIIAKARELVHIFPDRG